MGNEERKTHCSHKELQMQTMGNEVRLTHGVTIQTMSNEAWKTHCSHKELQCKQWQIKEDSHKELQCKQWIMKQGRLIVQIKSYNANSV
ncbi:hypothetical protein KSS87_018467 [Heliosperma pusillum]|nr:hypothetical protein KSS87_018467 [Heliosperma pusillum]